MVRRGGDSCGGVRRLSRGREAPLHHPAISSPEPLSLSALCLWANFVLYWGRGPAGRGVVVHGGGVERQESIFFTLPLPARLQHFFRAPADSCAGQSNSSPLGCRDVLCSPQ